MKRPYFLILFILIFMSCSEEDMDLPLCDDLNTSQLSDFQLLFLDLAFDQEFGDDATRLRKWNRDISYFVTGTPSTENLIQLNSTIEDINQRGNAVMLVEADTESQANLIIFFGTAEDYISEVEPLAAGLAEGSRGFTTIKWNVAFEITSASICVDHINNPSEEDVEHLIKEELGQSFGLINDTTLDNSSIFHQSIQNQNYSQSDLQLIDFMLGLDLEAGMCPSTSLQAIN